MLGRHKSKSILSELSQQIYNTPLKQQKLLLNHMDSPQINQNIQKVSMHSLAVLNGSQPPQMTQKEAMQRLK